MFPVAVEQQPTPKRRDRNSDWEKDRRESETRGKKGVYELDSSSLGPHTTPVQTLPGQNGKKQKNARPPPRVEQLFGTRFYNTI